MVEENKSLKDQYSELEQSLIKTKKEAEYFKNIAAETGRLRLQEIDQLSRLIAERKEAEKALHESEELLRATIESTADGILVVDEKGMVTHTNRRFAQMWQIPDELIKSRQDKKLLDFVLAQLKEPEAFLSKVQALYKTLDEDFDVIDFKDGRIFERFSCPLIRDRQIAGRVWSFRDITDRQQAERALRESELKYRGIFNESVASIYVFDIEKNFIDSNQAGLDLLGYTRDKLLSMSIPHVDADPIVVLPAHKQLLKGERIINYEHQLKRKDGRTITVLNNSRPLTDAQGNVFGIQSTLIDITERKRAEEALRESEEKFRFLAEKMVDIVWTADIDFKTTYVSPSIENVLGYSPREREQQSLEEMVTLESFQKIQEIFLREIQEDGKSTVDPNSSITMEVEYYHKDGSTVWMENIVKAIRDSSGIIVGMHGVSRDITDRKMAEEEKTELQSQLQQAQKMEAIGTLAGGIAHDFNNILGIILGNTELAIDDVPEWNPALLNLKEIRTASLRAKDVVRQLLSFARKSRLEKKPIDIAPIVKETLKLLRSSIPRSIEIRQNISKDVDIIMADPTRINQVLINLCTNAEHAIPEVGMIEVTLKNSELEEDTAAQYPELSPGRFVTITISDTGHGIPQDEIDRIFDPYFTTKEVGKGTGMGLAVVHGIVKEHNGLITVESELGKGTTFSIYFPAVEKEAVAEIEIDGKLPSGNESLLFIDDEKSLVQLGCKRLERLGYKVEATTSPIEALDRFCSKPDQYDLIITDMTMPQITGDKLVKKILNIRPDIPIILCTGFSEKIDEKKAKEIGATDYIEKPVDRFDFAFKVRKVLDGK